MKRLIGIILSLIVVISCTTPISVSAKVIEPEVVKTESWTTSYYIDDDVDTLYPYIQCEADIYNDGTIKLYMWNTHEWDGFATVEHEVTLTQTTFMGTTSIPFSIKYGVNVDYQYSFWDGAQTVTRTLARFISDTDFSNIDLSYFDSRYSVSAAGTGNSTVGYLRTSGNVYHGAGSHGHVMWKRSYRYAIYDENWDGSYPNSGSLPSYCVTTALPNLVAYSERPDIVAYRFTPNEDPTDTYNFRLFGHDITITPELLSGNIIAEPELTEQEKYIKQLEEENARLKASITNNKSFGDINGDNLVDVADAQMILNYYVYTLVNDNAESLEEWISKQ